MKGSLKKALRSSLIALLMCLLPVVAAIGAPRGDVNGDGEVTIADVNALINAILTGGDTAAADVNEDGEISLADINAVIDIILTPDPTPPDEGTYASGVYMSIIGFNNQLYTKQFSLLNRNTKGFFTDFVNSLTTMNGTVLYYADDIALDSLTHAPYPIKLKNVVLVTFTDGLDQGSLMLTDKGYTSDSQFASALASRICSTSVHNLPLQAFSIGLKGSDVTNNEMFMSNLRSLASSEDNVALVNNMDEVKAKFKTIADSLAKISYSYSHTLTLTIPGVSDGTRIRFTFDNVNSSTVANSYKYIEGTFNLASRSLTDVTYHGMTSASGTTIGPKDVSGIFITYEFDGLMFDDPSERINKNMIKEWYWINDYNKWQINSEFTPSSIDDVDVETSYSSAIVMLVLDCSSSLSNDFSKLKTAANTFINTLADYDSFALGTLSQSSVVLTVGSEKTVEILNGSGSFTVSGGDGLVTARIEGRQLILTGKQEGTTTLTITDVATQTTMTIDVDVLEITPVQDESFTVNGVSFKMVGVEGGTFTMGATAEQGSDAYDSEKPAHEVTLSSFSIGETEVTQALWQAVMGSNPSYFTGDLNRPVEQVSWNQCQTFITKLNEMTGKTFRLPTEAEWEYATRGGNLSQGYKYAGSNTIGDVAWYGSNSGSTTHPVGTKAPNELGLYDMSGNVWEWCQDWYGSYSSSPSTNPTGPASGSHRVYRGGSWYFNAGFCRVSDRVYSNPSSAYIDLGLRLAL